MNALLVIQAHGFKVRRRNHLPYWKISARSQSWYVAQIGDRLLSSTPWLQQWLDSLSGER